MNSSSRILLYEGRSGNESHARFNASFAVTVAHAYPECQILFRGQNTHLTAVKKMLADENTNTIHDIKWQSYQPKRGTRIGFSSFNVPTVMAVLDLITAISAQKLKFVCIMAAPPPQVLLYKLLSNLLSLPPTLIYQHGELGILLSNPSNSIDYQSVTRFNHIKIRNVVPGLPILQEVFTDFPEFRTHYISLTHPWLWSQNVEHNRSTLTYPVKIGLLGSASSHTGLEQYLQVALHFKENENIVFRTTGALAHIDSPLPVNMEELVSLSRTTYTQQEYLQRIQELSFGISLRPSARRRFTASGGFLDALDMGKPGIYLSTPIVAEAFTKMGDIGYLCQSQEEIIKTIDTIQNDLPIERYQFQQKTIIAKRDIYSAYHLQDEYRTTIDRFLAQVA